MSSPSARVYADHYVWADNIISYSHTFTFNVTTGSNFKHPVTQRYSPVGSTHGSGRVGSGEVKKTDLWQLWSAQSIYLNLLAND